MKVVAKAGEVVKVGSLVYDVGSALADLTLATNPLFKYRLMLEDHDDEVTVTKTATISIPNSTISVELSETETAVAGTYLYEFWLTLNDEPDCVEVGMILLSEAL
jgi:hypothetical protein